MLFTQENKQLPSLSKLNTEDISGTYSIDKLPSSNYLRAAEKKYHLKFTFTLDSSVIPLNSRVKKYREEIESSQSLNQSQKLNIANLAFDYLYQNNLSAMNDEIAKSLKDEMIVGLSNSIWQILTIKKNDFTMGMIIVCDLKPHPLLNQDSLHIGYIGINPELNIKEDRTYVRERLFSWAYAQRKGKQPITAAVASFNNSSLNLFSNRLKYQVTHLRFSKIQ